MVTVANQTRLLHCGTKDKVTKVSRIRPLRTMKVRSNFHGNPTSIFRDISVWSMLKVLYVTFSKINKSYYFGLIYEWDDG